GHRIAPAQSRDGLAPHLSGGRLDRHGMAGHHGRRSTHRLRGRAMRGPGCRAPRCRVPGAGPGTLGIHASVRLAVTHVGTAALGCPAERTSAICLPAGDGRAALDWTAEGAAVPTYSQRAAVLRASGESFE